jgi:hypothetical protein
MDQELSNLKVQIFEIFSMKTFLEGGPLAERPRQGTEGCLRYGCTLLTALHISATLNATLDGLDKIR